MTPTVEQQAPTSSTPSSPGAQIEACATRIWEICNRKGKVDPGTDHERIVRELQALLSAPAGTLDDQEKARELQDKITALGRSFTASECGEDEQPDFDARVLQMTAQAFTAIRDEVRRERDQRWRNDALEAAAQIAERYSAANPNAADIARDIRAYIKDRE